MSRRAARFTQADIYRAIKAVKQSGARMAVEILPDGTIRITPAERRKQIEFKEIESDRGKERVIVL